MQANHFTPRLVESGANRHRFPIISAGAIAGVPAFIRQAFGERVLQQASREVLFDLELASDPECFVPHSVMPRLCQTVEKQTGHDDFGLLVAPHVSVKHYGCWGEYVLEADTLLDALQRARRALRFHSPSDWLDFRFDGSLVRVAYGSAARGRPGYVHVASGVVGALTSIFRHYGMGQCKLKHIEFDTPKPTITQKHEEQFGCPVRFDAALLTVCLDMAQFSDQRVVPAARPRLTLDDVACYRSAISSGRLDEVVAEQVRIQLLKGSVLIDSTAQILEFSVRTLQRELGLLGTSFREITQRMKVRRAISLLTEQALSVTQISSDLGYSAPAHFARAFRKSVGCSPVQYRAKFKQLG